MIACCRLFLCLNLMPPGVSGVLLKTRRSAIAEGPRDASCQLKSCQLPRNSAETTRKTRVPELSCGFVCVIQRLAVLVELRLVTDRHRQTQARG